MKPANLFFCALVVCSISLLLFPACNKDSSPIGDNSKNDLPAFVFFLSVKNINGTPMPGLQVSLFSDAAGSSLPKENGRQRTLSSATTVGFAIERSCHVDFSIRELDGSVTSHPIDTSLQLGVYLLSLSFPGGGPGTRVFKGVLNATDEATGKELYRDSIYMMLWRTDAAASVVGTTTAAGTFEAADSLMFPGVLSLPAMTETGPMGADSIGTFSISKDVVITLRDTATRQQQKFVKTLTRGENRFSLVWNPAVAGKIENNILCALTDTGTVRAVTPPPNVAWRLRQNYPNPFN